MLLYTSGVHKIIDTATKDNTITNLKARLEIVEGEIDAGDNNIEVLNELQEVLNNLSNLGIITKAAAKRHYNTIKKDYF
jgi:ribosomal protein S20